MIIQFQRENLLKKLQENNYFKNEIDKIIFNNLIIIMNTIIINTNIRITSNDLKQSKIKTIVQKKLNDIYLYKFTKQYGYILEILDFKSNKDTILSRINQDIFIKCNVEMLVVLPVINDIYYAIVQQIYPQGVFIKLLNIFDTLIPFEYLSKLNYSFINGEFVNINGSRIYKQAFINVRVVDMKYDNKTFNCIAELCEVNNIIRQQVECDED